jgi:hypothetical protein
MLSCVGRGLFDGMITRRDDNSSRGVLPCV